MRTGMEVAYLIFALCLALYSGLGTLAKASQALEKNHAWKAIDWLYPFAFLASVFGLWMSKF